VGQLDTGPAPLKSPETVRTSSIPARRRLARKSSGSLKVNVPFSGIHRYLAELAQTNRARRRVRTAALRPIAEWWRVVGAVYAETAAGSVNGEPDGTGP
jgi:hypothetical protein